MPKVFAKLAEIDFSPQMYASRWFMTIFADYFNINIVVRILDIFLMEGRKILFRIALAIFKLLEKELITAPDLERPLKLLKNFPTTADLELLITTAHKFTFSRNLLDQLEHEYAEQPSEDIIKICKLLS